MTIHSGGAVVFLLAAVPGEVAAAAGIAMSGAIAALYRAARADAAEARKDTRDAIIAIKENQATVARLVSLLESDRRRSRNAGAD